MASTLTSNSFLAAKPRSRLAVKSSRPTRSVLAKLSFRIGKQDDGSSPASPSGDQNQSVESDKSSKKPFFFDLGKNLVTIANQPSTALSFGNFRRKDPRTVFVAGATGQSGVRIVQTLLRQGFAVRAGVSELATAQELARLAAKYKIISAEEARRFNAVESTFQDPESIAKAIGNASKVVVTIGPFEKGATSEVTATDALKVIQGAQLAGVGHVAVIYDASPGPVMSTYNVLDGVTSFFSNLFGGSQPLSLPDILEKVVETDVKYTVIKATLTEEYSTEYSGNVVVKAEGAAIENQYKVSKSQIASLVAGVFANTSVAEDKVVQVSTSPSAPSKPVDELFSVIPEDGRRKAYAEALAKAKAEKEATIASEKAQEAAKKLEEEEEKKQVSEQEARVTSLAEEAKEKVDAVGTSLDGFVSRAKDFGTGFSTRISWEKLSSQISTAVSSRKIDDDEEEEKPKVQIATIRGLAKARTLTPKKAVIKKPPPPPPKPKAKPVEPKPEARKVFGLFQQETIYIDDD